jgi:hypothetical protein
MQIDKQHNKSVKKKRNEYDHPPYTRWSGMGRISLFVHSRD